MTLEVIGRENNLYSPNEFVQYCRPNYYKNVYASDFAACHFLIPGNGKVSLSDNVTYIHF